MKYYVYQKSTNKYPKVKMKSLVPEKNMRSHLSFNSKAERESKTIHNSVLTLFKKFSFRSAKMYLELYFSA